MPSQPHPPAALVVAHPGHEIRVFHWMERTQPWVYVLTDGSGHTGASRLEASRALIARLGARPGPIFGRFSDREIYAALLGGHTEVFTALADELAASLADHGVEQVVGDAIEGFNPGHDVCRLVIDAAVARLRGAGRRRRLDNRDFLLHGAPDDSTGESSESAASTLHIALDAAALERKLAAARGYPGLEDEVAQALARFGGAAFASEILRPVEDDFATEQRFRHPVPPFYESHGERQVAAGHYRQVIRFRQHMLPVAAALRTPGVSRPSAAPAGAAVPPS